MRVGTHHSSIYENRFFFTPELSKTGQITPEAVLKNHSKSQKIIKRIYYDFSKLLQMVICPVLESSGAKKIHFHRLRGDVFHPSQ
jgi:hypothetical protein